MLVKCPSLLDEPTLDLAGAMSDLGLDELVFAACRGGWPSSLAKKTGGELAYTRKDGVHVVPIGCLRP